MSIEFTTARTLVELKIKRNNYIIELLDIRDSILKREIKIKYRIVLHNQEKKDRLREINEIEAQQCYKYDQLRAEKVELITNDINDKPFDIDDLFNEITDLYVKQAQIYKDYLEVCSQIPNSAIVTNVRAVINDIPH